MRNDRVDRHATVHQVRKRCKKLRSLLRLVREPLEEAGVYARENAWYRDTARDLSSVRDAHSMLGTLEDLVARHEEHVDEQAFGVVRRRLLERREQLVRDTVDLGLRLERCAQRLSKGRKRVPDWRIGDRGFACVEGGLEKSYARCRAAMRRAFDEPSTELFHAWRKRVKYHAHHVRALRSMWKAPMKARGEEAASLADVLGTDHDLSCLRATLVESADELGGEGRLRVLIGLAVQWQSELRAEAREVGSRLFCEKPETFTRRMRSYWQAWRDGAEARERIRHEPGLVTG